MDKQLRELERQANTGDPEARERLCAYKNRLAGLVGYPNKELEDFTDEEIKNTAVYRLLYGHAKQMFNIRRQTSLSLIYRQPLGDYFVNAMMDLARKTLNECANGWRSAAATFERNESGAARALKTEHYKETRRIYESYLK